MRRHDGPLLFLMLVSACAASYGCNASLETTCVGGDNVQCLALPPNTAAASSGSSSASGGGNCFQACNPPMPTGKSGDFPCDVESVLSTICRNCHSNPTKNGAPFPLTSYGATQQPNPAGYSQNLVLFALMGNAVQGKADGPKMPLSPFDQKITDVQRTAIQSWACSCGPPRAAGQTCQ